MHIYIYIYVRADHREGHSRHRTVRADAAAVRSGAARRGALGACTVRVFSAEGHSRRRTVRADAAAVRSGAARRGALGVRTVRAVKKFIMKVQK